ncbi:MAG: TolC family protein [Acidobacteriota bacterium]|nr:TolC family protein [Acidobacteriota bacterium]
MTFATVLRSFAVVLLAATAWPQVADRRPLTIQDAVALSDKFPSVEASQEQVNAAAAGIRKARTNYLPSVNAVGQINRATRNNVFGLLFPQGVIPNISGPVLGTDNGRNVWGSAVGALISWEPFDFGRRRALLESAQASQNRARLTTRRTRFESETTSAAAFLTLLASEQTVRGAKAAVDRAQVLVRSVKASVDARLRPGADLSRADTELDASETQLVRAEQSVAVAKISLAEFTGIDAKKIVAAPGSLLDLPSEQPDAMADLAKNPSAEEQAGVIEESRARLGVLQRTYRPTFELEASAYARGTGALTNGSTLGSWNGLGPNYFNVAAGFTVTFPLLSMPSIRAQEAQEAAMGRSAAATYRQVLADIQAQSDAAQATLEQAREIAAETPKEVADARTGFEQANAQYRAGLTTIVGVAEAQRLLAQAEIDDSLARLAVWRALLQIQIAQGDISSFLAQASR